jgi:U4/U6 small nuclear ribonucleoprotein PRP31
MSTLADELLQDFEDSYSEGEDQKNEVLFPNNADAKSGLNGRGMGISGGNGSMERDGDEDVGEDEEMVGARISELEAEDEEETKARVEKMQLGAVDDVRSVAGLMKTLEPVLEVSSSQQCLSFMYG